MPAASTRTPLSAADASSTPEPSSGRAASRRAGGSNGRSGSAASATGDGGPVGSAASRPGGIADDGNFRHSYSKDKAQLLRRLSRIEGQVRGIARMIEREEYCVDILQQTSALRASVDALSVLVLEDHIAGCVRTAAERGEAEAYVDEVMDVVRRSLGRPVRTARS